VMGGSMQAQGHCQMTLRLANNGMNPQAAIDAPRWRIKDDNRGVAVEWNMPADTIEGLRRRGHEVDVEARLSDNFGCAQIIQRLDGGGYLAASDGRKDGCALGL